MKALRAFDGYWFVPAPAARLALLRILIGTFALAYLAFGFEVLTDVDRFGALHFVPAAAQGLFATPVHRAFFHVGAQLLNRLSAAMPPIRQRRNHEPVADQQRQDGDRGDDENTLAIVSFHSDRDCI